MDNYPRGKLNGDDEGQLTMALSIQDKTVILEFGKSVKWLGLSKQDALSLAEALKEKAMNI